MPAFLINGTYRLTGSAPGGDSARFYPDDPPAFRRLGIVARTNSSGGVRLRLAGVDALEIAYTPRGSATSWHQPPELATAGATALATALGFDSVERGDAGSVVSSMPAAVPGHVVAIGADVHGRVTGFAFPARRRGTADVSAVPLDAAGVRDSANWMLLRQGLAFPVGFSRLHPDLRAELFAAAAHARGQQRGIWPGDVTQVGFRLVDREQVQDDIVLLPRLFRRLADYLDIEGPGGVNLSGFPAYLEARDDRLVTVPDGHVRGLCSVVEVRRQTLRLVVPLEHLVFFER